MTAMLMLAGALLSQAAMPATSVQTAVQAADSHEITASARLHRTGWLTTAADAEGQYRAWVNVSDLDLATDAGYAATRSRVQKASAVLCEMSGEQPQIPGFYNRGARECWRSTQEQASQQIESAREAARQGRPVATLGLSNAH